MTESTKPAQEETDWRGQIGVLRANELEEFLATGVVCNLACLKDDGTPYVVPCWFEWDGTAFWIIPRQRSVWARYLQQRPAVALSISDPQGPYRKVQVEGKAVIVEEPNLGGQWVPIARRMSVRYLGEHGPDYLEPSLVQPRWLIRVDVEKMSTWQGVAWHPRYMVAEEEAATKRKG